MHGGNPWRSDSEQSMLLGEGLTVRVLREKARYQDKKFTIATIFNP